MFTLKELKEQRVAAINKAQALAKAAEDETRELTDEEAKQADGFLADAENLDSQIAKVEAANAREEKLAGALKSIESVPVVFRDQPGNVLPTPEPKSVVIPAAAKRWSTGLRNFKGPDAAKNAYSFGQWALACNGHAGSIGWCREHGIDLMAAQTEGTNSAGGYLVPAEFEATIIDLRDAYGLFRQKAKKVAMTTDKISIPRRTGGLTAYFVGEGAAGTESSKTWGSVELVAKDLMILGAMSKQLSEDAAINVGDDLAGEIAYAAAKMEDDCAFKGDGTSTYGGITGFKTKVAAASAAYETANAGTSTDWTQVTLAELVAVKGLLPQYAETPMAAWYCSKAFFGQMESLARAAGGNTQVDIGGGRFQDMFLGYPVFKTQSMPASASAAEIVCLFGDVGLASKFGDRQGMMIDFSNSATIGSTNMFETNQIAIRGTVRFDIVVHDVGDSSAAGAVVGLLSAA